ncbi:hypothetical protein KAM345_033300 [Aeromonas caviae]|uniref:hypothetical protein n=1 Tax=Aeromonas caviae TaxID=648 RepID=UPI001CC6CBF0|nr:hypothetical protein [Aeromonas caviae]BDA19416.1 hypothetical protein KAM345_033300 [Aeromonas caviae]
MTAITEGVLTFTFPAEALVCKYDETSFYRNQFIKMADGIKAMDLAYVDGQTFWLIEVKDYRVHQRTKSIDLVDEMAGKLRNTLAGLWAAKCNANDQGEKRFATAAIKAQKIRVVLHLEEAAHASRLAPTKSLSAGLQQKMKQRLKSVDAHPCLVDQRSLIPAMNWTVTG